MQATMNHTHRQLTPLASNNKPKKREETFDFLKPSTIIPKLAKPVITPRATAPLPIKPSKPVFIRPNSTDNNKLLAGYMAHEFLTKGTLFGQPWDPARADAVPVSADFRKPPPMKQPQKGKMTAEPEPKVKPGEKRKFESYAEVSGLLKAKNGAHIPGIVNPTQLARFLHPQ